MRAPSTILAVAVTWASTTQCQLPWATPTGTSQAPEAQAAENEDLLEASIQFAVGSSALDGAAMQTLDALSVELSRARADAVTIEGLANEYLHLQTNLELAERRAQAVARYLASRGIGRAQYLTIGRESTASDPLGRSCLIERMR